MTVVLVNAWDPRHCNVVLSEKRYLAHIVDRHPGIEVDHIRFAVEEPEVITRDANDDLVENYYKRGALSDLPDLFLKVCVRFESDRGKVVTAFLVDRPKPHEVIIWKR
jgi:hypothetical protein